MRNSQFMRIRLIDSTLVQSALVLRNLCQFQIVQPTIHGDIELRVHRQSELGIQHLHLVILIRNEAKHGISRERPDPSIQQPYTGARSSRIKSLLIPLARTGILFDSQSSVRLGPPR
ncbi:hypothetical protein QLX08_000654 [Tetragonisca angustula]|uniref:Uncharacterized protein n=1 Tax=Tetragonisca angustula TaxID=166442 RepID=A0AAW1AIW9_9HYME